MGVCKFNSDWVKEFPWIEPVKGDKHQAWCRHCKKSISVRKGRFDVSKHGNNSLHINNQEKSEEEPKTVLQQSISNSHQQSISESLKKSQLL